MSMPSPAISICRCLSLIPIIVANSVVLAGLRVDVVIGPQAPPLERFAAEELAGQFQRLFDADVAISENVPADAPRLILLGSPATNPAVKSFLPEWPKLSNQGHVLRTVTIADRPALMVGGGTPVATLWAVYELGHHFGIRYALFGDMYPATSRDLKLEG